MPALESLFQGVARVVNDSSATIGLLGQIQKNELSRILNFKLDIARRDAYYQGRRP
jgi:hypothetical protein